MATLIEKKIGEHRGISRVYIEGLRLAREGFQPGMTYQRIIKAEEGKIVLRLIDSGDYVVSKKNIRDTELPVLDIRTEELTKIAGNSGRVRILIANKCIVILRHFNDEKIADRMLRMMNEVEQGKLSAASLFHGGGVASGGIHCGLKVAGISSKLAMAVEIEDAYIESSLRNNPNLWDENSVVINAGVEGVRYHQSGIPSVSLLEAGVPCTGSSSSGKAKLGLTFAEDHPTAGAAFFYTLQAIDFMNPCLIVLENVKTYATTASASIVRSVLGNLGYSMQEILLKGEDFGALENRERWVMLATTIGLEEFIKLDDIYKFRSAPPAKIQDILESEVDDSRWKEYGYLREKEARDIAAGKGFKMQILNEDSTSCPTVTRGYAKVRSTDPILSKNDGSNLLRLFTPAEHARLKTIPESVLDGLSETVAHQVAGQSVVYNWFVAIGRLIGDGLQSYQSTQLKQSAA